MAETTEKGDWFIISYSCHCAVNHLPHMYKRAIINNTDILNVLLTVHHSVSVYWNQRDPLFIQFVENQVPLHVSSFTCSSSGGAAQTAFSILRAYDVILQPCYSQPTLYASNIPNAVCATPPEDEQVMLGTCRGPLILIKLNEKCIALVSLYGYSDYWNLGLLKNVAFFFYHPTHNLLVTGEV
jgi:hypothetical protein